MSVYEFVLYATWQNDYAGAHAVCKDIHVLCPFPLLLCSLYVTRYSLTDSKVFFFTRGFSSMTLLSISPFSSSCLTHRELRNSMKLTHCLTHTCIGRLSCQKIFTYSHIHGIILQPSHPPLGEQKVSAAVESNPITKWALDLGNCA